LPVILGLVPRTTRIDRLQILGTSPRMTAERVEAFSGTHGSEGCFSFSDRGEEGDDND